MLGGQETDGLGSGAIDWRDKSLWMVDQPCRIDEFASSGRELFDGSVSWPALVLREPALRGNIETMADYVRRHGMLFAPHGKTSMAPALFRMQLDAGAWGITVATAFQAMVALRTGTPRVLIAHEVLDGAALRKLVSVRDELGAARASAGERVDTEVLCFVDSAEGVRVLGDAATAAGGAPVSVLIDVGFAGGRTGVRSVSEALELAEAVERTVGVDLVGTACYEGGLPSVERVREFFALLRDVTEALLEHGHLAEGYRGGAPLVSAGGSYYFDQVVAELGAEWAASVGAQIVLRSGASVTHDDGTYLRRGAFTRAQHEGRLDPALELWVQVVSAPEPGLVLVNAGKRDVSFDEDLPVPKRLRRTGSAEEESILGVAECSRLNDQHGYIGVPESLGVRPGDLICLGISHPCTTFDKWRSIVLVDGDDRIVDVVRTYF